MAPAPSADVVAQREIQETNAKLIAEQEVDAPVTIVPKKPNWDLKRDLAPKLERLQKRTQHAIAEIVRERIASQTKGVNASAASVTQQASAAARNNGAQIATAGQDLDEQYRGPVDAAALARAVGHAGEELDDEAGEGDGAERVAQRQRRRYDDEDD